MGCAARNIKELNTLKSNEYLGCHNLLSFRLVLEGPGLIGEISIVEVAVVTKSSVSGQINFRVGQLSSVNFTHMLGKGMLVHLC